MTGEGIRDALRRSTSRIVALTHSDGEISRVKIISVAEEDDGDGIVYDKIESNRPFDPAAACWCEIRDISEVRTEPAPQARHSV